MTRRVGPPETRPSPSARATGHGSVKLLSLCAVASLSAPATSAAQARQSDEQIWASVSGTIPAGSSAELRVDGLVHFVDGASRPGRTLLRVVGLKRLRPGLKVGGGYVWTEISPQPGLRLTEHRAVQEVDFQAPLLGDRVLFASRTQLEQRWREAQGGASIRLRQRARVQIPGDGNVTGVVAWTEYFHELRDTAWSGPAGPALILAFAGVHIPVTDTIAIEPGYLNQTEFNAGRNRVRHVAAISATVRF